MTKKAEKVRILHHHDRPYHVMAGLLTVLFTVAFLVDCTGSESPKQPAQQEVPSATAREEEETRAETEPAFEAEHPAPSEPTFETELPAPSEPVVPPENQETAPLRISTPEALQEELYAAIRAVRQPAPMDISGVTLSENPEIDVKNLYYSLTSRFPELKYAYDISAAVEDGCLICQISYMPYKTGDWPENPDALPVFTLDGLLRAAEEHLGAAPFPIRVMDPSLTPDDMNQILGQAGGGYILCALNRDGTEITDTPAMGMEIETCLSLLEQADRLAEQVAAQVGTDSMTEREKAEALYGYLTSHVKYDHRYTSDPEHLPYDTRTTIGALRDGLAICGGYAHSLKLLFEQAGIPCRTVTGSYYRENHMWNMARLDGAWLWFDATADRGVSPAFGFRHFAQEELDPTQYRWEPEQVALLLRLDAAHP